MDIFDKFHEFFDCCVGKWSTERTYHYLTHQEVERSRTEFVVDPLIQEQKSRVLADNQYAQQKELESKLDIFPGFHLSFQTVSEKGERVEQALNLMFVPYQKDSANTANIAILEGDYLRDRAYEEAKPIISHFRFHPNTMELLMTTNYTRTISVDSITLVNPNLRIRKIINYRRPPENKPPEEITLVGFGVEQKVS
ncbi:MAG: phycobiliprotein lyase [Cyanobacteria bacterium P01_A01_bin.84]